jgi:nicotinamidase-related amidase
MEALIVVDAQNEFSTAGQRAVPNHPGALDAIRAHVARARKDKRPIAWIRHHNRPHESRAFVPGSWGAELSPGLGPQSGFGPEVLMDKDVFGAFTGTELETWLRERQVDTVLLVGFYAHMCVATSTREALVRGFDVALDPEATGACDLQHPQLGRQDADDVRRSAFLHLSHMGAVIRDQARDESPGEAVSPPDDRAAQNARPTVTA